jgi:hypothetical protein
MNTLAGALVAANLPAMQLDEQSVSSAAIKQTGLTDFGDPYYQEGLWQLLESAENIADLYPLGRLVVRDMVVNYLVQRLQMVETRKKEPAIFAAPLHPPLIIMGFARSGTTFLHNLLSLDPAHRALPQWLLMRPFPVEIREDYGPDPRIKQMEKGIKFRQPMLPGLDAIHYTRADSAEECIVSLGITFNSLLFPTLFPVFSYMNWYLENGNDLRKFQEYRWLLQVFQSQAPDQRLTLKAPAHTGHLDSLRQVLPQAMLIQTHRDPSACVSSACNLTTTYHLSVAREIDIPRMVDLILQLYVQWARRNLAFRQAHPGLIYDVAYETLVAAPIETVHGIYAHYGLPWSDALQSALEVYIQKNPKHKHGRHNYEAQDFGLTQAEIDRHLGFYEEALAASGQR